MNRLNCGDWHVPELLDQLHLVLHFLRYMRFEKYLRVVIEIFAVSGHFSLPEEVLHDIMVSKALEASQCWKYALIQVSSYLLHDGSVLINIETRSEKKFLDNGPFHIYRTRETVMGFE